ncbi:DUF4430 domain-containing protein [Ornithinibacillus halophilus]|uniref:Transcobalamin-like C-terminal domain-containing protein n=1 Tax=Ornithinibacillus halophilus TaxID=930117 RepID=A0A1M5CSL2_9BACI|nr:DUF4430 domain-containing protein [Ornithinibacillus halophilus]SHF57718.1 protein of unknown function [Ornithinibacillus halophilus]
MTKFFLRVAPLLVVFVLVTGCGNVSEGNNNNNNGEENQNNNSSENQEEKVYVTISKDDGEEIVSEKEISIEEGDILMDVMEDNFEIETEFDGAFITSIDGVAAEDGEEKGWLFFINDEMPVKGANELELTPGDKVNFDFQAWE